MYDNDTPGPILIAMFVMSWVSSPKGAILPMLACTAWTPFVVPAVWLVASGIYSQPVERFLAVSLLNCFVLTLVRTAGPPTFF